LVDEQTATVKSVPVRLGETLAGERVAVEGLAAGQLLVSAGVQRLAEGQAVRLPEGSGLPKNRGGQENLNKEQL
jgi:multidrug efflux system membrane fusion protein